MKEALMTPNMPQRLSSVIMEPKNFLQLVSKSRHRIKRSRIIPPKLGKKGFGKILVEFK